MPIKHSDIGHRGVNKRTGAAVATLAFIVGCSVLVSLMPTADAAPTRDRVKVVTMLSEPGDYIGQGDDRFYNQANATIKASGDTSDLTISVSGGNMNDSFVLAFAPPRGEDLHHGLYTGAQGSPEAGRPLIHIFGDARGCSARGRFDVKHLVVGDHSRVEELWLTFEQRCVSGTGSLFGEVRLNVPNNPALVAAPAALWWPSADMQEPGTVASVRFKARRDSTISVASVDVVGDHTPAFPVRFDGCTGVTLEPGASCDVWIRFRPPSPGPWAARLVLKEATGRRHQVALDGFGVAGSTRLVMQSDAGDYIGQGDSYSYDPANAAFSFSGDKHHVRALLEAGNGDWWDLDFAAPQGDVLVPGTYTGATRYPFNGTGAGLDVSGSGRGCNQLTGSFTVTHATVSSSGSMRRFGVDFEQHCEGAAAALRGTLEYRVPTDELVPPASAAEVAVTRLRRRAEVTWTDPVQDYAFSVVRYVQAWRAPRSPNSGLRGYVGQDGAVTLRRLDPKRPVAVSVFTVDAAGNVGRRSVEVAKPLR